MYDPRVVQPMREELTSAGIQELTSVEAVDGFMSTSKNATALIVVNSVCGCAAGGARPGVKLAMSHSPRPANLATVFAGQDKEATDRARSYFVGLPPSSPSIALLKNGEVVHMLHRRDIEGNSPEQIAKKLTDAFDRFC